VFEKRGTGDQRLAEQRRALAKVNDLWLKAVLNYLFDDLILVLFVINALTENSLLQTLQFNFATLNPIDNPQRSPE